jgi:ABC-2 type transport system permease protein
VNEFITVYSAEVLRRLRSRAFIIGLAIGALGIILMIRLPSIIESFTAQSNRVVLAGDPALIAQARPLLQKDYNIAAAAPGLTKPTSMDLRSHKSASAFIVLTRSAHAIHVTVYTKDPTATIATDLRRDLLPLQVRFATKLPSSQVASMLRMPVDVRPLESKFGTVAQADQARIVANVLIVLLYLLIVLNSQLIMTSVAEEKTTRIAELLVASVSPNTLLAGKIAASASLALLQMAVWVAISVVFGSPSGSAGRIASQTSSSAMSLSGISAYDIAAFAIFFLLGYLQMATMFAAIGSLINRTEDIGSIGGPFFIPIVAAFFLALTALDVPDAPFIVATSFIPLIAPFVMFARIIVSSVPLSQIVTSFVINAAAVWAIALLGGKIYRIGMLLYGRPPKLSQLWHSLRA